MLFFLTLFSLVGGLEKSKVAAALLIPSSYSPNIVRVIKPRRMRWAGHVARMVEERGAYRVLVGIRGGRDHWGDLGVDGWIILGWISRRWDVGMWTGLGWSRIETGGVRL